MPKLLRDIVRFRGDRLFDGAVNIDWYGSDEERARAAAAAFVFHGPEYHGVAQADVGLEHGHRLEDTATFARSIVRRCYGLEDGPFTLAIAGYGTGKSHLALALAALLGDPKSGAAEAVLASVEAADGGIGGEIRSILQESGQPCLVVALNGMQNFDLANEITRQITQQLMKHSLDTRTLDELRPRFSQAASLVRMANTDVLSELCLACDTDDAAAILARLEQHDELVYSQVHKVFSARGMTIAALRGESIREVIEATVLEYCGENKPFRTLLLLFDEFGRYTEFATNKSQVAGSGVLQDLFEGVQANAGSACLAGFIQFELNAYIQRVAPEYRNEMLRYVTRYQSANRAYLSINLETLVASLVEKRDSSYLGKKFDGPETQVGSKGILGNLAEWFPQARNHRLWCDPEQFHTVIRKGCWPLSPYATWFLYHLAAAGKHLQERSALALLGDVFERFSKSELIGTDWAITPVDLWSDALQQELLNSEEGGHQGAVTLAYASVDARHGSQLPVHFRRVLRAIVLASKMGLNAADREDATSALAELAGLTLTSADEALRALQDEYNVVEWDEAFREFDILGDAVPRTQFLSFVRQRVSSGFDEAGKAALFAGKAAVWSKLLGDQECDFAEENDITTREWHFKGVASNVDLLPMQVKLAADRWCSAVDVAEPRGTVVYCYVEPSRAPEIVERDTAKLLKSAAKGANAAALPLLVVLLCDEDGALGQALAELAVLEESISDEDRARFGNLIAAHQEKTKQFLCSRIENMIKQRRYVTPFKDEIGAHRLNRVGTEIFSRIYKTPLPFPFDGFSTAHGNAADSCQELTIELLLGRLDYEAVLGKPVKVKNRAVVVLKENWKLFAQNGSTRARPSHPIVRGITEKWDDLLASGERRLSLGEAVRQLCMPPYGANLASAGLMLGAFVAPRIKKLVVVQGGEQVSVARWVQDGIFRGKYIDPRVLQGADLVLLGEESSEWDLLLGEWEQAESHFARTRCLERAEDLKERVPVPPLHGYRYNLLAEAAENSLRALVRLQEEEDEARRFISSGEEHDDVAVLARGAALLAKLQKRLESEGTLWTQHDLEGFRPAIDRARQAILQRFSEWLKRLSLSSDSPDAVGEFKHKMTRLIGGNLIELGLNEEHSALLARTAEIVKNAETMADAHQLLRDARSWMQLHADASRLLRVAEIRDAREVGRSLQSRLQGMSLRIQLKDVGEARAQIAEVLTKMKEAEDKTCKRLSRLWDSKIRAEEDLWGLSEEVDALILIFEGCPKDLEDLALMRRTLRSYLNALKQLTDERQTWAEFHVLSNALAEELEAGMADLEVPWPAPEVIASLTETVSGKRDEASAAWIESLQMDAAQLSTMSAIDANRLHARATVPPPVLNEKHEKRLKMILRDIEARLDTLSVEWLVAKYKELPAPLQRKFLKLISPETVE